ncbi:TIGR04141 family sporadically distributed protein [Acinetobacter pittii]|uniref:DUF6119 family protein n=1 Tax=Acinetobacter pittii TaxID=48296 RepID=UPI00355AD01B
MGNTYNIYKIRPNKYDELIEKIEKVDLIEQKTIISGNYEMTFYFSEKLKGNEIWWWTTYREFFNKDVKAPSNHFFYGLLLCRNTDDNKEIYAVSLGKSHFYLSKFIEFDFGISLAVRMADENTILLKKSRYFTGTKRQDISSYASFVNDSYESGESVEHIKLKATDKEIWGEKNIIFADSIQMDINKRPEELVEIFNSISDTVKRNPIINLPKLEAVTDEILVEELDNELLTSLLDHKFAVGIEEIRAFGINICFSYSEYSYEIVYRKEKGKTSRRELGNSLDILEIAKFVEDEKVVNLDNLKIQFKREDSGVYTSPIKEVIDYYKELEGYCYFLKNGEWFCFNSTFMEYLKRSLDNIETILKEDLIETEYLKWRAEKAENLDQEVVTDNKILYREYYFNQKLSQEEGYVLLDRQLKEIRAIETGKRKHKIEVADLYKDNEIISVKIASKPESLIYNIEQSKTSIELIMQKEVNIEYIINSAALWFVFDKNIQKITDISSIQFLLAIDSWKKRIEFFGLKPRIYISKHNKVQ